MRSNSRGDNDPNFNTSAFDKSGIGQSDRAPSRVGAKPSEHSVNQTVASKQEPAMNKKHNNTRELVFIDRHVDDLATLLAHMRPEIDAIVLDPAKPALAQVAQNVR